ncbi:MAG: hypothetical protein R6X15_05975 [Pseudomonadota bacterium]
MNFSDDLTHHEVHEDHEDIHCLDSAASRSLAMQQNPDNMTPLRGLRELRGEKTNFTTA